MSQHPMCVYHRADFDGKCAAAIVRSKYLNAELVPYDYGDDFDLERCRGRTVYMVDCSLQPFVRMQQLRDLCLELHWIDHHKTAIADRNLSGAYFQGMQLEGIAGCELTWSYLYGDNVPEVVRLLGRYDVWDLGFSDDVLPFQYGLRRWGTMSPESPMWQDLFANGEVVQATIKMGRIILEYVKEDNAAQCKAAAFEAEVFGLKCICLNSPARNSMAFESVYDAKKHDAMLAFYNAGGRFWRVSLYTSNPQIDVGAVAKRQGGGGHRGAAGFQLECLPMVLLPKDE